MKGYTDIFGGILPPVPGFYFRTDAYHYNGDADRTIFDGFAQLGVEEDYTATPAPRSARAWRSAVGAAVAHPYYYGAPACDYSPTCALPRGRAGFFLKATGGGDPAAGFISRRASSLASFRRNCHLSVGHSSARIWEDGDA